MLITVGFTEPDEDRRYSSFMDGYRLGARQDSVTFAVEGVGTDTPPETWAEAVFEASNHPAEPDGLASAIRWAWLDQVKTPCRTVSIGDTVTIEGQGMWACDRDGWHQVGWSRGKV